MSDGCPVADFAFYTEWYPTRKTVPVVWTKCGCGASSPRFKGRLRNSRHRAWRRRHAKTCATMVRSRQNERAVWQYYTEKNRGC